MPELKTTMPPPDQRCGSYPFLYLAEDTGVAYRHVLALADYWATGQFSVWQGHARTAITEKLGYAGFRKLDNQIQELVRRHT